MNLKYYEWLVRSKDYNEIFYSLDYLKITDEYNETVGKYCGEHVGEKVLVGGDLDHAVITFHSDSSQQKKGFRISFTAVQTGK